MQFLYQLLINGIIIGSIYTLISLGYALTLSININNFAHGSFVIVGSFLGYMFLVSNNYPFWSSLLLITILGSIIGYLVYFFLLKRIVEKKNWIVMIAVTFAVALFFDNLILIIHGFELFSIRNDFYSNTVSIYGLTITDIQIYLVISSILLYVITYYIIENTKIGLKFKAVSNDIEAASIMGINSYKYILLSLILGGGLATLSGILIALDYDQSATSGISFLMIAYTSTVLGGIYKLKNVFFAAYILGISESLVTGYVSSEYSLAIIFVLLIIFLLVKNEGFNKIEYIRKI